MENIEFKELSLDDIHANVLDYFNRYQKVTRSWSKENETWVLLDIDYVVDWDKDKKEAVIQSFSETIIGGGFIFGAYEHKKLIGFAVLRNNKFGTNGQYIQLKYLHVSLDYRHKGIGKTLFGLCIEKAKKIGTPKIYISANDSEETQQFYAGIGCKDAMEINKKLAEDEPYDRQMEYEL